MDSDQPAYRAVQSCTHMLVSYKLVCLLISIEVLVGVLRILALVIP